MFAVRHGLIPPGPFDTTDTEAAGARFEHAFVAGANDGEFDCTTTQFAN
ncbi:hypothetical protein OG874_23585 [Nocardia sp. NBC_00565]|nr:hypothetical protein [Nocardia sp. NBC_00565]WUB99902.1 hypothetical protein OG874_23585 [Nocardia sp. NBC_00565]